MGELKLLFSELKRRQSREGVAFVDGTQGFRRINGNFETLREVHQYLNQIESTTNIPENYLTICFEAQCGKCDGARIPELFYNRCQKDIDAHEGCCYLELTHQRGQN